MKSFQIALVLTSLAFAGCAKKTEPDCFECGLTDEWARAEAEEKARKDAEAEAAVKAETADESQRSKSCADAEARAACAEKGPPWVFAQEPYIYCSGMAPTPEEEERMQEAANATPCTCFNEDAVEQRREECSMVPSMAPDPNERMAPTGIEAR